MHIDRSALVRFAGQLLALYQSLPPPLAAPFDISICETAWLQSEVTPLFTHTYLCFSVALTQRRQDNETYADPSAHCDPFTSMLCNNTCIMVPHLLLRTITHSFHQKCSGGQVLDESLCTCRCPTNTEACGGMCTPRCPAPSFVRDSLCRCDCHSVRYVTCDAPCLCFGCSFVSRPFPFLHFLSPFRAPWLCGNLAC